MHKFSIYLVFIFISMNMNSQSILGKWKTMDDETGEPKSIVEITEKSGKIYAKVIEILNLSNKNALCQNCSGEDKNKPILGLTIIKGLKKDGSEYNSGQILDPKNGKLYKCSLSLESKDKLKVRGYIGFSLLGRTQYWHRVH